MQISPHFHLGEFDCHDGTPVPARGAEPYEHLAYWFLEPMRAEFGKCWVRSGYRTPEHNRGVGGAQFSVHLLRTRLPGAATAGRSALAAAADVTFARGKPSDWLKEAESIRARSRHLAVKGRGGIGTYPRLGFVHLDIAARRNWRG